MESRLFDHIDLRVRNRARAREFFAKILPVIGFTLNKSTEDWGTFEKDGAGKPSEFFGFTEALEQLLGRRVDLAERKAVETSRNYIRRRAILRDAEMVYG